MPPINPDHLSPTGSRVTPRDRRPTALPPVFLVSPSGCRHHVGSLDGARANAIRVLMGARDERAESGSVSSLVPAANDPVSLGSSAPVVATTGAREASNPAAAGRPNSTVIPKVVLRSDLVRE